MTLFKTKEEFQHFLDTSPKCLCGRLLTGLHERNCNKIREYQKRFEPQTEKD